MPTAKLNSKRIDSVTIKRMLDTDPDTSWLGEYSNKPNSKYSIDRAHSEDCQSLEQNHREPVDKLESIIEYLNTVLNSIPDFSDTPRNEDISEAQDLLIEAQDSLVECDCTQDGWWNNREYRYFNPVHENYKGLEESEIRQYCKQDYEHMKAYNNQQWYFVGIRAEAEIVVSGICQTITSGGIWGIESDSDKSYFAEVEAEELSELRKTLEALGFSKRAISTAFKSVQTQGPKIRAARHRCE